MSRFAASTLVLITVSAARTGAATEFTIGPAPGPAPQLLLERFSGEIQGTERARELWQLVCVLPCTAETDAQGVYRLRAPDLDFTSLNLLPPLTDHVWVDVHHNLSFTRVWLGWGFVGAGVAAVAAGIAVIATTPMTVHEPIGPAISEGPSPEGMVVAGIGAGVALAGLVLALNGPSDAGDIRVRPAGAAPPAASTTHEVVK